MPNRTIESRRRRSPRELSGDRTSSPIQTRFRGPGLRGVDYATGAQQFAPPRPGQSAPVRGAEATGYLLSSASAPETTTQEQDHPIGSSHMGTVQSAVAALNLDPAAIRQLQRYLANGSPWDVQATGTYDLATARAVMDEDGRTYGIVSEWFFEERGLLFFERGASLAPPNLEELMAHHKDGLTLSVVANYQGRGNDAEFHNRGRAHADLYQSVGMDGGVALLGEPIFIDRIEDLPQKILQVVRAIREEWSALFRSAAGSLHPIGIELPEWHPCCFVKNLSLFSHGIQTGLSLNREGDYSEGLHDGRSMQRDGVSSYDLDQGSTVQGFVRSVADVLAPNVDVQLFACNAGLSPDVEGEDWSRPDQGAQGGEDSFANHFLQALRAEGLDDSSVFAHITAGHTTENFSARVFGARAEEVNGDGASASLFDLVFPPEYVTSQVSALGDGASTEQVRSRMWRHVVLPEMYQDGAPRGNLGMRLFTDLDKTREHFQRTWEMDIS